MGLDLNVLILVPAIAGVVVVGFPLAMLAANAYLQVLQGTAAGAKTIEWPSESIPDHFVKVFYVAWILLLVFGPAFILGRSLAAATDSRLLSYAVILVIFWLVFPLCQLSSLGGPTVWLPIWPALFSRMKQKSADLLAFYAFSAVVLAGFAISFFLAFGGGPAFLMLPGVPLVIVCWLLYARVLGRFAFVLMFTRSPKERRKKKPDRVLGEMPRDALREAADRRRVHQPSQQVALETPHDGPLQGYDVRFEDSPPSTVPPAKIAPEVIDLPESEPIEVMEDEIAKAARERRRRYLDPARRWDDEDDDATPYVANVAEVKGTEIAPKELLKAKPEELRLLSQADSPRKPRRFWTPDLLAFLFHPTTAGVIIRHSLLLFVVAGMFRIARAFTPAGTG